MKRKLCIFLILILTLSFGMVSAQAATVVDRVVILEQAIGLEAGSDALISRIEYLEAQLGVAAAAGATIEDRIAALEAILGVAPAAEEAAETVMYKDSTPLTSIGYFTKERGFYESEAGKSNHDTDNYGTLYSTMIYSDEKHTFGEYLLGGNYKEFTASIYVNANALKEGTDHFWDTATISIYGDDVLLYQATGFDAKDEPLPVSVNIEGVKFLKIEFNQAVYSLSSFAFNGQPLVVLGNPAVVK